jgi:hypothetical protein
MVRYRRTGRGQETAEVPERCPEHGDMAPSQGQCPDVTCRQMIRLYRCLVDGCGQRGADPDHVHRDAVPRGVHHGG